MPGASPHERHEAARDFTLGPSPKLRSFPYLEVTDGSVDSIDGYCADDVGWRALRSPAS